MIRYNHIKKLLFKIDPERVHQGVERLLPLMAKCPITTNMFAKRSIFSDTVLEQELFGRKFYNPVGLAAGYDKDAKMLSFLPLLGFGFVEVGTVTPLPQKGNPKPRLFRHKQEESLQNAMGFNNSGMEAMAKRLERLTPFSIPIGVNIGKNKLTEPEQAIEDYAQLVQKLEGFADYIVVNISSPNTPGLRDLQNEAFIEELFTRLKKLSHRPILLKVAPDLKAQDAIALCKKAVEEGASGIIATNTSNDYSLVANPKPTGGISGKVLQKKSFALFEELAKELFGKTTLISVGGIDDADEVYKRIRAGASLVQVYTALIYNGPKLVYRLNQGLTKNLKRDGFNSITEAIGADRKQ